MTDHHDGIEWIDTEPDAGPADIAHLRPAGPRWRWWYAVLALGVVALLVVARSRSGGSVADPAPTRSPVAQISSARSAPVVPVPAASSASAASSAAPSESAEADETAGTPPPVAVIRAGHPIMNVPAGWELFARGPGVTVRLQLAAGRITTTQIPELSSESPVSFDVGTDRAIIRPLDSVVGFLAIDGRPSVALTGALALDGPAIPGPDADHVWAPATASGGSTMELVDLAGHPTGPTIRIPADAGLAASDGAGYLSFYGTAGVYDARPSGIQRITTGQLLATGKSGWLTVECDARYRCVMTVIDRSTEQRRTLDTPVDLYQQGGGVISPDGRTAALLSADSDGETVLHLLDLVTGVDRVVDAAVNQSTAPSDGAAVWAPNSATLFVAGADGAPLAVDRSTGRATPLNVSIAQITQLAFRS